MVQNNLTEKICIDQNLIELFDENLLDSDIINYLVYLICEVNKNQFPISFITERKNVVVNKSITLHYKENIISKDFKSIFNTWEPDKITENAAICFFLSFFQLIWKVKPRVVRKRYNGYDYQWKKENYNYQLEISGVNSKKKDAFSKRIWNKKDRFKKYTFNLPDTKKLIGIIDFLYQKYCIIEVMN